MALLLVLLVLGLLWWGVAGIAGLVRTGAATATQQPGSPAASATTTVAPTAAVAEPSGAEAPAATEATAAPSAPATVPACTAAEVLVTAVTDAERYAPEVQPQFALRLEHRGQQACTLDIGTATQLYTVTSGSDVIWLSSDCQQEATNEVVELAPGQQLTAPAITWVRERSAPETCAGERPAAGTGDATYYLTVGIGGFSSEPARFVLE